MNFLPLALAALCSCIAGLCAISDGALLALEGEASLSPALVSLYGRRERTHRALAFTRVVAQLASGAAIAMAFDLRHLLPGERLALAVTSAALFVGVSESLARSAGDTMGVRAAERFHSFIVVVERVLLPVVTLGTIIDRALLIFLPRPDRHEEDHEAATEQFVQVVAAEAEVSKDQEVLLNGVFALGDTEVHEIMVPRVDIVAIDRDSPWSEVVDRLRSSEHARLPVYVESIDNIVGVLYAKDMLPWVLADSPPPGGWVSLVRPPVFIPGAKKADRQLRDFQSSGTHMAIVADEFGGTAGLITIEDVLEEIVGDIRDEYDVEEATVEREGNERFWVSARLTLGELSEVTGHDFRRDDVSTVGGLVYEHMGRVPRAGEEFVLDGFRVVVERVVRRRVQRVYFERLEPAVPDEVDE